MSELRKNDIVTLEITDMNNLGYGIGRYGGVVVFVRGGVSGDLLDCRIIKVNKSYLVGKTERIITPSPYRATEKYCDAPESCGGCVFRNVEYEYECSLKRSHVINAFRRAGLRDVAVGEVMSTGGCREYRNKALFPVGQRADGGVFAGFFASGTHRIAGDENCTLHPHSFAEIVAEICGFATAEHIEAYDERTGRGLLRNIYLRHAAGTGEIMVCLVINGEALPIADRLANRLMSRFPAVVGVLLNINKKNTNVTLGEKYITVAGRGYIEDMLCGLRFRIAPDSFYQVNHDGAELLYAIAREMALAAGEICANTEHPNVSPKGSILLDLYCGAGTIGLSMAADFDEVIGIEIVPSAVRCADENAQLNGINNAKFYCGDATETGGILAAAERERGAKIEASAVILDPPRKGSTPELIKFIANRKIPRVVYVSCAADTLARDCALFRELGYSIGEVMPVDMFPRTGHVECVVGLER